MHLTLFSLFINCFPVMCCISEACTSSCLCRSCSNTDLQPSHGASSVRVGALPVPCLALIFFPRLFVIALSSLLSNTTDMVKVPETTSHCIEFRCYKKKMCILSDVWSLHWCCRTLILYCAKWFFFSTWKDIKEGGYLILFKILSLKLWERLKKSTQQIH